jgi:hypothetical protein
MPTTKANEPSAATCYVERYAQCQDLLKRIAQRLRSHRGEQAQTPAHWTHAGDLGHVREQLTEVLAFLGGGAAEETEQ